MISMKTSYGALAIAALAALRFGEAFAESRPAVHDATIPFANYGGIRDWTPDRERGLWIQGRNRKWYYASFMGSCTGLNFATALAFDTRGQTSFDRWATVIVPHYGRCAIKSFTASEGPPKRQKAKAKEGEEADDNADATSATANG
ncbi:MAG TPA: DUF6491 family protein [Steroidobacteraceae bacterium]|jgi:hypothetical protein|nr:DUF6491 family protein [Steroidobacteraceae bacterium]